MPTKTEIANFAIAHLGGRPLVDVDTDTTQQAIACQQWFATARDEFLRSHPWNFATKRKRQAVTYLSLSGSAVTNNSGAIRVTYTAHGLLTGDRVFIKDVEGVTNANGRWYVTKINDNTFDLDDSEFSGTYTTATGKWVKIPQFNWWFQHTPPTDMLRILKIDGCAGPLKDDGRDYAHESGLILCNVDTINITYVASVTTYTEWPADVVNVFSRLLASYIAANIQGAGTSRAGELRKEYEQLLAPIVRRLNANDGKPPNVLPWNESQMIAARFGFIQTAG